MAVRSPWAVRSSDERRRRSESPPRKKSTSSKVDEVPNSLQSMRAKALAAGAANDIGKVVVTEPEPAPPPASEAPVEEAEAKRGEEEEG